MSVITIHSPSGKSSNENFPCESQAVSLQYFAAGPAFLIAALTLKPHEVITSMSYLLLGSKKTAAPAQVLTSPPSVVNNASPSNVAGPSPAYGVKSLSEKGTSSAKTVVETNNAIVTAKVLKLVLDLPLSMNRSND